MEWSDKSKRRKITLDINIKPHYDVAMSSNLLLLHPKQSAKKNAMRSITKYEHSEIDLFVEGKKQQQQKQYTHTHTAIAAVPHDFALLD